MAKDATTTGAQRDEVPVSEPALDSGTYEIIRNRLRGYAGELRARLNQLNEARKEVFGSIDTALVATERVTTAHNCVPRDMVAVGNRFLFGYNVHFGLKAERGLADVFSVYEFRDNSFHELPLDLIRGEQFEKHFQDVYRYYKDAVFARFFAAGPHLYMVFRVGKTPADIKTFKWAIEGDGLAYVDNRSDHEVRFPPQHEFEWTRTHRDMHYSGPHPHISIEDRLFVETVGGDLTIKIENNTDSGEGIYSEPVDNPDQTLDDAEVHYASVGNIILLKIRPYQEQKFRYFVYNEKIHQALRLDAIEDACVLLPDDHGLIFSSGYYLQTGEHKTFESGLTQMLFERRIAAPNGEDYLYVFYNRESGARILLGYNVIAQRVETPVICNGSTFFHGGELILFKAQPEPQKHHAIQVWQTPYVGKDYVPEVTSDSYLFKIGNRDIVRAMAECHEVLALIEKDDTYSGLYVDLVKETGDILDSYFWVDRPEAFKLREPLAQIKDAAAAAISEFDKVVRVKQNTATQTRRVESETQNLLAAVGRKRYEVIGDFVTSLADLRRVRGEIIALRDLRYVDRGLIDGLEGQVAESSDRLAKRAVEFLLRPDALQPYLDKVRVEQSKIGDLQKVADARKLEEAVAASAAELEMLIEIVSNLAIDDATHRTAIIDSISAIFTDINQARAAIKRKTKELASVEGVAEFSSQMKLLNQSVVNYLDVSDTPEKCEEFLTRVMIQLEELEGRFAEFDEFVVQLAGKRDEVYNAFESKKLALVEARNKRAGALAAAADRILKGIKARVESFALINDIHGYFASDLMIEKVRDICGQLTALGDTVKLDDIQSRLKTIREDAVRQLKDRQELFVGGENVIRLGQKLFNVNAQALDLTTVVRDGRICLHLTGTNFFEPLADDALDAARDLWDQDVVSESREVYRAEYLACQIYRAAEGGGRRNGANGSGASVAPPSLDELRQMDDTALTAFVQKFMAPRYSEGYTKGVHDQDVARILRALVEIGATIGLLRYQPGARALAAVFWEHFGDAEQKDSIAARLAGFGMLTRVFANGSGTNSNGWTPATGYVVELREMLAAFVAESELFDASLVDEAAEYLFCELTSLVSSQWSVVSGTEASARRQGSGGRGQESGQSIALGSGNGSASHFVISRPAARLFEEFHAHLKRHGHADQFARSVAGVGDDPAGRFQLLRDWVGAFVGRGRESFVGHSPLSVVRGPSSQDAEHSATDDGQRTTDHPQPSTLNPQPFDYVDETARLLDSALGDGSRPAAVSAGPPLLDVQSIVDASIAREIDGMAGTHPVIADGRYRLHFNRFLTKLDAYQKGVVPRYERLVARKKELVAAAREELRLEEFRPRVLTSFVRNRLLDTVYLPLIGDNLAKQMGEAGEGKRTDRMGLLLVISPPGYGKTTLMEYVANRLGVIFMKINGPALGHDVKSLDPAAAPNAAAREELEKLNLAFEMGDNVMLYVDDIQHTHPEFLQKFISLCDAQRKIEGIYKGRTRTYDFRGRKVAVVMAGNPYTESGQKFQIPDMLANRADVYNLGEVIGEHREAFESSYLENAVGSNPVLNKLAARSQKDVFAVIKLAERARQRGATEGASAALDMEGIELEGNYALEELNEMVSVMRKLMRVRDVVLTVNREYIKSAAQADEYRIEPPFKLQGSYRNMSRIAERVLAVMNDDELESLIMSSYESDAQTLTTGTEANLLKFKELLGKLTPAERERWEHIKRAFVQTVKLKGVGTEDKFGQAIVQLSTMGDGLDAIRRAVAEGVTRLAGRDEDGDEPLRFAPEVGQQAADLVGQVRELRGGLERIGEALTGTFGQIAEVVERAGATGDSANLTETQRSRAAARPPEAVVELLEQLAADLRQISAAAVSGARGAPVAVRDDQSDSDDGEPDPAGETCARTAGPTDDQRITVVNKLPRTVMNVLERQFEVMQNWLTPLLATANAQTAELQQLRASVEACLRDYEALVGRLGEAQGRERG